jgi:4-amino-4-deoxy-L-arabinose transferase-like glycosyltransferase
MLRCGFFWRKELAEEALKNHCWWRDLILLTVLIGSLFAFFLGSRPLNVPDEGRYCEIPREMMVSGDFITPRINGIKYFEKPPLFYWMQSASLHFFGQSEWSCRLMDALMALLGCLGIYVAGRNLFNRKTGLFSAVILASSLLYFALARVVTLDMTVSIYLTFSLLSFILGVYSKRVFYYFVYIFAGFAVLTKGLIGIIFPGSIIFLWLLFTHQWKVLKECKLFSGILLFLCITIPWHVIAQLRNPEFFYFYFIDQQFIRYLTLEAHRYQPDWYYIPILLLGLFPWTGFLWGSLKNIVARPKEDPKLFYLLLSFLLIFVFYSFSKSKLVPYILPCFGFLSLLIGKYFADLCDKEITKNKQLSIGFAISALSSLSLAIAIPFCLTKEITVDYSAAIHVGAVIMFFCLANTIIVPFLYWKKGFLPAFFSQLILAASIYMSLCVIAPYIYMDSVKPFAEKIKPFLKAQDKVAVYDYYYQDLPFYLNRLVTIVDWKGELEFGAHYAHDKSVMIDNTEFWRDWNNNHDNSGEFYMVIPKESLNSVQNKFNHQNYTIMAQTKNDLLIKRVVK